MRREEHPLSEGLQISPTGRSNSISLKVIISAGFIPKKGIRIHRG